MAFAVPFAASAEDALPSAAAAGDTTTGSARGQVYEPGYFERFAPRTALDMLEQVPGFQITGDSDDGGRGLGQASQNVLVNGARLSSKSEGVRDQLKRIPAAKVLRIEIVEGTSLGLPGLSGPVANVTVDLDGVSGSFAWKSRIRATSVDPEWYGGEISLAGRSGALNYTLALRNNNDRGGSEGPGVLRDAAGAVFQREDIVAVFAFDKPTLSANLGYDFGGGVTATLNLSYNRAYFRRKDDRTITGPALDPLQRAIRTRETGYEYEVGGDIAFPLAGGKLKLIGLERFDREDFSQTLVDEFDDPALASRGSRFTRLDGIGERIGRAEYDFSLWGGEWQIAGEAAFNRLGRVSGLGMLGADGSFVPVDFPQGTGGVTEDRYEFSASLSRPLGPRLGLQVTGAYELSTLRQTGSAANDRSFARPKGSVSLAWSNGAGLDVTATAERKVGQLSFGDFLASVFLDNDNANGGNNQLVPQQSWETRLELSKTLGRWGSTSMILAREWVEDYIDIIPIGTASEARGNIDRATFSTLVWNTTLKLDSLGWRGAQLNAEIALEDTSLRDPLTGEGRSISEGSDRETEIELRHDVPGSDIAWGSRLRYERKRPYYRTGEIGRTQDGPAFLSLFLEHKDLLGLTGKVTVGNLLGGRDRFERTVWNGYRDVAPVRFTEDRDRRIGPILRFDVSGNF
ncbi:TonB-dependent receptor plug domain-containing protein [Parerythrobacter aurantius]|uniref:TonB-dependent receptor plug domain-containing protein n=1 Tax=Parerythrobacter aurantius TaxID=3127706 RepID=UPI0032496749